MATATFNGLRKSIYIYLLVSFLAAGCHSYQISADHLLDLDTYQAPNYQGNPNAVSTGFSDVSGMYGCFCVPVHLCTDNDAAVNGAGLLDLRNKQNPCKNYFEICCDFPITDYAPPSLIPPPGAGYQPPPPPPNQPSNPDQQYPSNGLENKAGRMCGYQTPVATSNNGEGVPNYRITGTKTESAFGELPWTVVILYKDSPQAARSLYKCGGSLIHEQVVLTAAHCLTNSGLGSISGPTEGAHWTIRAGEWNTNNQEELLPHQDRVVGEIVVHEHYHDSSLKNDIALLVLTEPVSLADNVGLVCLPPFGLSMDGIICTASGWGKNAFKKGRHSAIMRKVELPIVDRDQCLVALRNTRLGAFYQLHQSFICAGGEGDKDTCKGDGGSPLVCPLANESERYVQMGIVSWGIGCGDAHTPGVYVNVALYRDWIDTEVSARGMDVSAYRYDS